MWICIKCSAQNEDQYTVCPQCGASRSAGRFGAAAAAPRNAAAYAAPLRQNAQPSGQPAVAAERIAPLPQQMPQAQYVSDFSHVHSGRGYMILGTLLSILLPLTVLLFAVLSYFHYAGTSVLALLLFSEATNASSTIYTLIYGFITLVLALLSALPGLWTLAIGKALRRLARMEELL